MKKIVNPWIKLEKDGYNCFGCAPNNPYGLKMEFYEDGDDIVSFWTPTENYQGWLHTLHGWHTISAHRRDCRVARSPQTTKPRV